MKTTLTNGGKRPRGKTAARVIVAFDRSPKLNSIQLGKKLGLHPAYIRKTLARNGRKSAWPVGRPPLPLRKSHHDNTERLGGSEGSRPRSFHRR